MFLPPLNSLGSSLGCACDPECEVLLTIHAQLWDTLPTVGEGIPRWADHDAAQPSCPVKGCVRLIIVCVHVQPAKALRRCGHGD